MTAALPARPPHLAAMALAAAAGAFAAWGFAPVQWIAPAILGAAALLWLLQRATGGERAFALGWAFGWGNFALGFDWIATAFGYQAAMPPAMGWVAVVGLGAFLGLYPGLAAWAAWRLGRTLVTRALWLAAAWMLTEWLRGTLFSGFAWNPYGSAWLQFPGVAAAAALVGSAGLSALAILCGAAMVALATPGMRGRYALMAVLPATLVLGAAWAALRPPLPPADGPTVLIVQANVTQTEKLDPTRQSAIIGRYMALTAAGFADHPQAAVAIWPEASIDGLPEDEPALRQAIASVIPARRHLLFGAAALIREGGQVTAATNSLFAIDATTRILWRYDKAHLVPGGEYLPLRWLAEPLGLARVVPGDLDFRPGPGPLTLTLPGLPPLGATICYEIIFAGAVTQPGRRPRWLLTVSNDAWFGASGPPQHWAQARLRAIEEGLPIIRSTPTGVSGAIDARGGVAAALPAHAEGVLATRIPAALPPTPFARLGHAATALFGLLLAALAFALRERKV